jgi:hypothetical protein
MHVLSTEQDDGIARMTVCQTPDDHIFEVWVDGDIALVEYQETLSYRGTIRVSEPEPDVYEHLMLSDEMTTFLDEHDCSGVKRARTQTA